MIREPVLAVICSLYPNIHPKKTQASEIMSKPVISVGSEASIYDASLIMTKYNIRRLPIVRDNILLGIVTATDLSRHIYERNKEDPTLKAMSRFISRKTNIK